MKKENMVVLSMAIKIYIEIEKAATKGCFKIIWPMIRRTPRTYSVGGLCTFNSLLLKLSSEFLYAFFNLISFTNFFYFRYRMNRELFLRIMNAVESYDDYFVQKWSAANVAGLSCFQKVTSAFRMLTYGVPADATDEYVRIGESAVLESLRRFVAAVVDIFEDEYLRSPNEVDTQGRAYLVCMGIH